MGADVFRERLARPLRSPGGSRARRALDRCRALARARPWHHAAAATAGGLALASSGEGLVLAGAALAAAFGAALDRPRLGLVLSSLVLAGAAAGGARLDAIDAPGAALHDGDAIRAPGELLTRPRASRFGWSAEVRLLDGHARGARLLARAPQWLRLSSEVAPGAELRIRGRFSRPRRRRGETFDFAAYLRRRGIEGELRLDSLHATGRRRAGLAGVVDASRERATRAMRAALPPSEAALLRGMVLGEDEAIPPTLRDDFRASGLAHLLAVSGQNVMLLGALALPALVALGLSRAGRMAAVLALIAVYVPLAGAGPSLQRAGVMGGAAIVASAASRPASRSYALLLAAVATLGINPRALGDVGWQLSFAAVAAIIWLAPPLRRGLESAFDALRPPRPPPPSGAGDSMGDAGLRSDRGSVADAGPRSDRGSVADAGLRSDRRSAAARRAVERGAAIVRAGAVEGGAVTVAATLATAPLLAHHFGSVPLASLPANLLALPAVAPAMWGGMALAALGQVAALGPPLAAPSRAAAALVGTVAAPAIDYLAWLAERFAAMPQAKPGPPLAGVVAVAASYVLLALGALGLARAARRAGPRASELAAAFRRLPVRTRFAAGAVLAAAGALAGSEALMPPIPPDRLTVSFLDVGQGDATLVQHPDGTAVLFDGGPPEGRVERSLRRAGVRRLSAVVMTHASRDHHGGLLEVVERHRVGLLLDGGDGTRDHDFRAVVAAARRRGVRVVRAVAPLALRIGSVSIEVLSPPPRPPGPPPDDPNPRAVVAVVSAGSLDVLLSGDAESEALAPLPLPDVDAMKVPHHGSADPGLPDVLGRLRPELAVVEVGRNDYGHPAPSTLAALRAAGVRTWRTDRDGTVKLNVDERGEVSVATEG
ncbi:MAG: ComEC/Rec2 family competence protein [Nocardioidaceae bacterium]